MGPPSHQHKTPNTTRPQLLSCGGLRVWRPLHIYITLTLPPTDQEATQAPNTTRPQLMSHALGVCHTMKYLYIHQYITMSATDIRLQLKPYNAYIPRQLDGIASVSLFTNAETASKSKSDLEGKDWKTMVPHLRMDCINTFLTPSLTCSTRLPWKMYVDVRPDQSTKPCDHVSNPVGCWVGNVEEGEAIRI